MLREHKVGVVLWSLLFSIQPAISYAELTGDPQMLNAALKQHRENVGRIKTWRGTAEMTSQFEGKEPIHTSVTFYCDTKQGYLRWTYAPKRTSPAKDEDVIHGLVRNGRAYRLIGDAYTTQAGETQAGLVVRPLDDLKKERRTDAYFDPVWYLTSYTPNFEKMFEYVSQQAAHPMNRWVVTRTGDSVVLEKRDGKIVNRWEVDLSQGGNVVGAFFDEPTPGSSSTFETSWQQVAGVWIPRRQKSSEPLHEKDGVKIFTKTIEWTDNVINEPIDEEIFSPDSLPLNPGDRVNDIPSGISYEFKASQAAVERIAGEEPKSRRHWLLIGCLGIIVPLSGYLWWRRAARS